MNHTITEGLFIMSWLLVPIVGVLIWVVWDTLP
jgi:hypothetical protein